MFRSLSRFPLHRCYTSLATLLTPSPPTPSPTIPLPGVRGRDRGGVIENVLSDAESAALVEAATPNFESAKVDTRASRVAGESDTGAIQLRPDIRNNERWVLEDPGLADAICARMRDGMPRGLAYFSPVVRFYRYTPGSFFKPHVDGGMVDEARNTVLRFSVLVYLNTVVSGGGTHFHSVRVSDGKVVADDNAIVSTISPAPGKALFFFHKLRHSGQTVHSGLKHVLRFDAMYHNA